MNTGAPGADGSTDAWLVEASRQLDEPTGDVARLIDAISTKLPAMRRPGRPLASDDPAVAVNDRVLKKLLATRVRSTVGRLVVNVALDGSGADLSGVTIGLIARYRDDLRTEADRVREVVGTVLVDVLGETVTAAARADIGVHWQDVYTREWLT